MKKEDGKINLLMLIMIPVLIGIGVLIGYFAFSGNLVAETNLSIDDTGVSVSENNSKIGGIEGYFISNILSYNSPNYSFHLDGNVSCEEGDYSKKGTYIIENDTIKIKFNTVNVPGTDKENKTNEKEELVLIDEDMIEGYTKIPVEHFIMGRWTYRYVYDKDNNPIPLSELFGTLSEKKFVPTVSFNPDGTYTNRSQAFSSENDKDYEGTYEVSGDQIILKSETGKTRIIYYSAYGLLCFKYDDYYVWLDKDNDRIWAE